MFCFKVILFSIITRSRRGAFTKPTCLPVSSTVHRQRILSILQKIQNTGQAREREKDAWEQTQVPHKSQSNTQYTPRRVHPKRTCILDLRGTAQRTTGNPCTAFIPVSIPEALGTCAQTTCAARTPPWISPKTPTSTNTHVQKQPFYMCVTNDLPKMSQRRTEERALDLDD